MAGSDSSPQLSAKLEMMKSFFTGGDTRLIDNRRTYLKKFDLALKANREDLITALHDDLGKPLAEAYLAEYSHVLQELALARRKVSRWSRRRRVSSPLFLQPMRSYIEPQPLGVVLIVAPWNYPLNLSIGPLIGAIAAGNCVILKPSELAPHTANVLEKIVAEALPPELCQVVKGDVEVAKRLLKLKFNHIFFTGSTAVGRAVAIAAAENLIPVTLELGGKSPCIVDTEVELKTTARRIVWGKFSNAGQTCVAPDYILVKDSLHDSLVKEVAEVITEFYGTDPRSSPDYGRMISTRHFDRVAGLMSEGKIAVGGGKDRSESYIAPTVLTDLPVNAAVMSEEIFGPVLPVLRYQSIDDALATVARHPEPLALYLFSNDDAVQQKVTSSVRFGGGMINDTTVHLANPKLPFGGVGQSGNGRYHGFYSFETFSHWRSHGVKSLKTDQSLRYPPYGNKVNRLKKALVFLKLS